MGGGPADAVLDGAVPAGTPTGARTAGVTSEAPVAASGGGLGVGGWFSANGWWPVASDAANEQPLIPESAEADPNVQRAAVRRVLRLDIRRAARSAASRAVAEGDSRTTPPTAASAAEAQAGGPTTDGIDCASEPAADGAPSVAVPGGGTNPYAATVGPGIWGWPSDWPAAPNDQQPTGRRSRTRGAPAVIRLCPKWCGRSSSRCGGYFQGGMGCRRAVYDCTLLGQVYHFAACSRVVSLMSGCRFGEQAFGEDSEPVREMAVQNWLTEEDNEEVRAATADRIVFEKGGRGDGEVDNRIEDPADSGNE